jgi:hypothetical protein
MVRGKRECHGVAHSFFPLCPKKKKPAKVRGKNINLYELNNKRRTPFMIVLWIKPSLS